MQRGLPEPQVVFYSVAFQVPAHFFDIVFYAEAHHVAAALFLVLAEISVAVFFVKEPCYLLYVFSVIAVLRENAGVLPFEHLDISRLHGAGEHLHLMSGVVYVEFPPYVVAGLFQHRRHRVSEHAASGVAYGHRAGGVRGNELHHHALSAALVYASVIRALLFDLGQHAGVPLVRKAEIDKARSRDLRAAEAAAVEPELLNERLAYFARRHSHALRRRHGV